VDVPRKVARTTSRAVLTGSPTIRLALAAALGHSGHGSTRGVAVHAVNAPSSTSAARAYSWRIRSTPSRW
jgi:hypothetical protein